MSYVSRCEAWSMVWHLPIWTTTLPLVEGFGMERTIDAILTCENTLEELCDVLIVNHRLFK